MRITIKLQFFKDGKTTPASESSKEELALEIWRSLLKGSNIIRNKIFKRGKLISCSVGGYFAQIYHHSVMDSYIEIYRNSRNNVIPAKIYLMKDL